MHKKWCDAQKELYPDEPVRQLQRLSDTRWACRVVACRNVRDRLDALIVTLEDAAEGGHSDRSVEAIGLLSQINFNFVLFLHLFCDLASGQNTFSFNTTAIINFRFIGSCCSPEKFN